jgi:hypothetical protein
MFFLLTSFELIKLLQRIQTNSNYFLFFLIKYILLFAETDDFNLGLLLRYLGFLLLILEYFSFCFKGFLFENFRYSIDLANIISLVLTNILGVSSILNITRGNILLLILFITSIRCYVSFSSFSYYISEGNKTAVVIFG